MQNQSSRNGLWEAVVNEWFPSGIAGDDARRIGRIVSALRSRRARPEDVIARRKNLQSWIKTRKWPEAGDTPEALVKHWDQFATAGYNPFRS